MVQSLSELTMDMEQIPKYCIRLEELIKMQISQNCSSKKLLYYLPILQDCGAELYFVLPRILDKIYTKDMNELYTNYSRNFNSEEYTLKLYTTLDKQDKDDGFLYYKLFLDPSISGTWYIRFADLYPLIYFQIPPRLSINTLSKQYLKCMDEICLLTLVPKFMGPLNTWIDIIKQARSRHSYNCFHFLPMLQRGKSDSPYSIYDQLSLSIDEMFPSNTSDVNYWNIFSDTIYSMKQDPGGIFLIDIVWNHTSFDSPWLKHHPEVGYNAYNSPHLRPAILLDDAIITFSSKNLKDFPLDSEQNIKSMLNSFRHDYIPNNYMIIKQYFTLDSEMIIKSWNERDKNSQELNPDVIVSNLFSSFMGPSNSWRFKSIPFDISILDHVQSESLLYVILEQFQQLLFQYYHECIEKAMNNLYNRIVYERIDPKGPRLSDKLEPFVSPYFTRISKDHPIDDDHDIFSQFDFFANNGWVWNADPNINFATWESNVYLCREVIIWGDCVKLKYDENDMTSWIWKHMEQYTTMLAKIFDGFRIDNCHSTPINVAKHFIQIARKVKPNIYIFAELFTGNAERDMEFVTQLGINSLLRESIICQSMDSLEHQLWTSGGLPIGSFNQEYYMNDVKFELLLPSSPHTLLMDCTHDNATPLEQGRDPSHALANAAMISFSNGAIGSTKGCDELSIRRIEFVGPSTMRYSKNDISAHNTGLFPVRSLLNKLHVLLSNEGYIERHIDTSEKLIKMTRSNPATHDEYILVARPSFNLHHDSTGQVILNENRVRYRSGEKIPLTKVLDDRLASWIVDNEDDIKVVLWSRIHINGTSSDSEFEKNENSNIHHEHFSTLHSSIEYESSEYSLLSNDPHNIFIKEKISPNQWKIALNPDEFHAGSILVLKKTNSFAVNHDLIDNLSKEIKRMNFTFSELNILLFHSDAEEKDKFPDLGVYNIPDYGSARFCGFFGIYWILEHDQIIMKHDLGHPLCENIRQGDWLMNYLIGRLERYNIHGIYDALKKVFIHFETFPYYLKPKYVCYIIQFVTQHVIRILLNSKYNSTMDCWSIRDRLFVGMNALISNMSVKSGLFPIELTESHLLQNLLDKCCKILSPILQRKEQDIYELSLSAGLPHFSTSHMRLWGRDVFISFVGAFIATNRPLEGLIHIIAFASCLYKGLIPNLLDSGRYPRYNARDSTWWFIYALKRFIKWIDGISKDISMKILDIDIPMRFGSFEQQYANGWCHWQESQAYSCSIKLSDIIHYIMTSHARGIDFVEDRAGKQLDHAMKNDGFHIQIHTDFKNGFIYGGNKWNCGTWMDKMGDASGTSHFGIPATSRDGACIELIALLYDTLCWINDLEFIYKGVTINDVMIKWSEWMDMIERSFEPEFLVNSENGIYYRDVIGCSDHEREMQLRPNYVIAISIAPKLFDRDHACKAIETAEKYLLDGIGLKSLAPYDPLYRPSFNPHDTWSGDVWTMNGFNYHNGPTWVWPYGHYIQAKAIMNMESIQNILKPQCLYLLSNHEIGLPELIQDGKSCEFGCFIQTWSLATILEAIYNIESL